MYSGVCDIVCNNLSIQDSIPVHGHMMTVQLKKSV